MDEENVPSMKNETIKVKVLMALADDENLVVDKETDESSICSTPLPSLEKLSSTKLVFGPKTIKSILKSKSTFKAESLKAPTGKLKSVKIKDDPPLAIVMKELNDLKLQISKNQIISLEREIKPRNLQHVVIKRCETCGSTDHNITDHYDIVWFRRGEELQAKNMLKL
ncbi:hypothetical protein Tco_0827808 [Tanacetum coccineum]